MRLGSKSRGGRRSRSVSRRSRSGGTLAGRLARKFHFLLNTKLLLALILLWIVYEGLLSQHSVVNLYKFRQERDRLAQELAAAEAKRDSLKTQVGLLESDKFTIEKLAREKMGLAKEGEIIYRYEEPATESSEETPLTPPIVDEGDQEKPDESSDSGGR
jgi:cell division protein FtsB